MSPKLKKLVSVLGPTALFGAILSIGAAFGYWAAIGRPYQLINERVRGRTLAYVIQLRSEDPMAISRAYSNPDEALRHFDDYLWDAPAVWAPFVGGAPQPGRYGNAVISPSHFRNDTDPQLPKPPGVVRIILLGGSTAFGSGAPSQDTTIGGYLEKMLSLPAGASTTRRFEVFTLACPAWASTQERILVENRVLDFDPDVLVSLSGGNDIHWGSLKQNVMNFRTYTDGFFWEIINDAYRAVGRPRFEEFIPSSPEKTAPTLVGERLERNVRLELFSLEKKQVPLLYFFQPSLGLTKKPLSAYEARSRDKFVGDDDRYFELCHRDIQSRLRRIESPLFRFIDLTGMFDGLLATETIFIDSYHFGDKGNGKIASVMASCILQFGESRAFSAKQRVLDDAPSQPSYPCSPGE